jgi:hypothetical protein
MLLRNNFLYNIFGYTLKTGICIKDGLGFILKIEGNKSLSEIMILKPVPEN